MIGCPLPKKDFPYDNAVIKSVNRDLGNPEMIRGRRADIAKLRRSAYPGFLGNPYPASRAEWPRSSGMCSRRSHAGQS